MPDQSSATTPAKPVGAVGQVASWLGAAAGFLLVRAFGAALWVPGLLIVGGYFVSAKFARASPPAMRHIVAIQLGQLAWIGIGLLILGELTSAVVDAVVLAAVVSVLIARPRPWVLILLAAYQAFSLIVHSMQLSGTLDLPDVPAAASELAVSKGLVVHSAINLALAVLGSIGWVQMRRIAALEVEASAEAESRAREPRRLL